MTAGVDIGGSGGSGSDGGNVEVTNSGSIVTLGDNSSGIFAQSVGGGGGAGGSSFNLSAAVGANSVDAGVNLGGSGGGGGDAGSVTVNNSGSIRTGAVTSKDGTYKVSGLNSFGIYAQSVGGGGGASAGRMLAWILAPRWDDRSLSSSILFKGQ